MCELKFRAWDGSKMVKDFYIHAEGAVFDDQVIHFYDNLAIMQFTGLKDKNGLQDLYECDIVDIEGNIIGNIYENDKRETDLVIQGFGTKDWFATYKEAVDRGCKDSK